MPHMSTVLPPSAISSLTWGAQHLEGSTEGQDDNARPSLLPMRGDVLPKVDVGGGSEGGDRRSRQHLMDAASSSLNPLPERHQPLGLGLDLVGPSAPQRGRGRYLRGHLLVSLVLATYAELLEVVRFFVHLGRPPATRRGGRSDSQPGRSGRLGRCLLNT